ncbi:MAG: hypothetical protein KBS60_04180 [Phascolarctobacterium sp.]|nr:hypothetical protein [Candidatus Phascolarctobacterium caballi]
MNYYGQNYYQPMPQPQGTFTCRAVTSREEAMAAQTDYFSMGTVMPDLAHGVIYLKRFNSNTGSSDFLEFKYCQPEQPKPTPQYVTLEEFNAFKDSLKGGAASD